ncbi:MAG: thioredoxin [Candidatus Cloacimonetes bacterium]|nr:thioredoxin [Candidatus Cloacimonadota bacterium]
MALIEVNENNFTDEVTNASCPVVVDLWAPWCGPCRALAPTMEEINAEFNSKAKVVKINIDDNPAIAAKYNVMSIPTILFFKDGQVEGQLVGLVAKEKIADKLNELL